MATVHEVVDVRPEVTGELHGIISLYKLLSGEDDAFEREPERVLEATYPSRNLRRMLQRLGTTLGDGDADRKGNFILRGGYGSGKSHLLLALYHLIDSPEIGEQWLEGNDIGFEIPEDCHVILMPMTHAELQDLSPVDYLWQPVFEQVGYEGFDHTGDNAPTARHLQEAVGEKTVLLVVDELERWFLGIQDDAKKNANLTFIQNLTEFCEDPDNGFVLFLSLLGIAPDITTIVERVDQWPEDLTSAPDRDQFVLHRLVKDVDREAAEAVVDAYIEQYKPIDPHLQIGDYNEYRQRMLDAYPFHPETIEVVFDRYSSVARAEQHSYQNSRGAMYLLAHVLRQALPSEETDEGQLAGRDLLCVGDISLDIDLIFDDLLSLDPALVGVAREDLQASSKVENAAAVLSTILLHSIGEEAERHVGARQGEIFLGALRPGDGDSGLNASAVQACLQQLQDTALHLHQEESPARWLFREEVSPLAQINRRARGISQEDARDHIVQTLREIVGDNDRTAIYPHEEIPNRRDVILVVSMERLENEEIEEEIYAGRSYANGLVIVEPADYGRIDQDDNLVWQAKRILAAEEMESQFTSQRDLRRQIRDIRDSTSNAFHARLRDLYGRWQVPVFDGDSNSIGFRRVPVKLDRALILGTVEDRYTEEKMAQAVMRSVRDTEAAPPTVADIRDDFYRQRSYPKPVYNRKASHEGIDTAIRKLVLSGDLKIIKAGDGKELVYEDPGSLSADWSVTEGDVLPEPRPEWILGFIGSDVKTAAEIRAECQERAEKTFGKPTNDAKVDKVVKALVAQGKIEAVQGPAELETPLSPGLKIGKKQKRDWEYVQFEPEPPGALVTDVVQDIDKRDLLRNVNLRLTKTVTGKNIGDEVRAAVGLSTIGPGEDTEVSIAWSVQGVPTTNRDQLVAILKSLPDDPGLEASLTLGRMRGGDER